MEVGVVIVIFVTGFPEESLPTVPLYRVSVLARSDDFKTVFPVTSPLLFMETVVEVDDS